jgi:hypothetical protein
LLLWMASDAIESSISQLNLEFLDSKKRLSCVLSFELRDEKFCCEIKLLAIYVCGLSVY